MFLAGPLISFGVRYVGSSAARYIAGRVGFGFGVYNSAVVAGRHQNIR